MSHQQEIIQHALNRHTSLPLRSENYDRDKVSFLDLAADQYGIAELDTSDWQVVYGRRGTGKTHLLKSFDESKRAHANSSKSGRVDIAFYFSAQDFRVSEENIPETHRALSYFQVFIDQLSARVLAYVDHIIANEGLLRRLVGSSNIKREKVEDIALKIGYEAQYGDTIGGTVTSEAVRERKEASTNSRQRGWTGEAKAELSSKAAAASVRAGASAGSSQKFEEGSEAHFTLREVPHPRFDKVKSLLLDLIELISVDRIFILIDEWPLLDPTGLTRVQPEFANLLKRVFSGSGRVSIKIATNRFQTRLSYRDDLRGTIGLELDADIFEAVNLDHALLQERELQSFYETMIFKRLCFCSVEFSTLMLRPEFWVGGSGGLREITPEDVPVGFIELLFRDRMSFVELTKGCEGIPRDFLDLFNRLTKKASYPRGSWALSQVREIIRDGKIASSQTDLEYNSPSYRLLNISLKASVLRTGRREFSVHIDDYNTFSAIVDVLLEKRIIHEYPVGMIPEYHRDRFKVYLIDYGYCLDWAGSYGPDPDMLFRGEELIPRDIERIRLSERVIDEHGIIMDRKKCPACEQFFSPEAKSYVKKRLCPTCFEFVG